jgi:hypothetical protein
MEDSKSIHPIIVLLAIVGVVFLLLLARLFILSDYTIQFSKLGSGRVTAINAPDPDGVAMTLKVGELECLKAKECEINEHNFIKLTQKGINKK